MISGLTAALAARLGAGILLAGGLIGARWPAPPSYSRFLLTAATICFGVALVLGTSRPEFWTWVVLLLGASGLRLSVTRGTLLGSGRLALLLAGVGLLGATVPGVFAATGDGSALLPALAHFAGTVLLGTTAAAMVLGHWYLVDTALSIRPLLFAANLFCAAALLRAAVALLGLGAGGARELALSQPADLIYSTTALFFSFRVITGLVAPLVVSWLVRGTVRIRSTQSATGLLYVALILVLFGELTAVFLEGVTGARLS